MEILYRTLNGNAYPLSIYISKVNYSDINYDYDLVANWCKIGCRNYGRSGGCPPLAPRFNTIPWSRDQYFLIIAIFDSKYKTEKVRQCSNRAIHWKFQDAILARFMYRLGEQLVNSFGGHFLATGYCMGCPGQKCAIKTGKPCRNIQRRTFSMEATGINVVNTVQKVFHKRFYWYHKNFIEVPYMMKCILYNGAVGMNADDLLFEVDKFFK